MVCLGAGTITNWAHDPSGARIDPQQAGGGWLIFGRRAPIEEPLIERLPVVRGLYEENAELGKRSWFRTGGKVEVLFQPADADDLQAFMEERRRTSTSLLLDLIRSTHP